MKWLLKQESSKSTRTKKRAVTPAMIEKIEEKFASAQASLQDLRAAVICVIAYAGFFRISELLSLKVRNLKFQEQSSVTIRVTAASKTDQVANGFERHVAATGKATCPVQLLRRYLHSTQLSANSFLLTQLRHDQRSHQVIVLRANRPLAYGRAREIFTDCIRVIGCDPKEYSLHMLRKGGATAAIEGGICERSVQRQGGWRSKRSKEVYIQTNACEQLRITSAIGL